MAASIARIPLAHSPHLTAHSHGWPYLEPFVLDGCRLEWLADLPDAGPTVVRIEWEEEGDAVALSADAALSRRDGEVAHGRVAWMFRAEEDFSAFWERCQAHPTLRECARRRGGGILRSATVFEDVVKTLCTVNCHWRNTKRMVAALCRRFGEPLEGDPERSTFPPVERIAAASLDELRELRLGYRAPYVLDLARSAVEGRCDLDQWAKMDDTPALREELLGVSGIGPYAAHNLLVLLGHYSFIPCDSEVCAWLGLPPRTSAREVQRLMEERYAQWGEYAYLAYKFERILTRHNYVDDVVSGE